MNALYIICGLGVVAVTVLGFFFIYYNIVTLPPQPPSLGVCSPSDSPYVPTFSQQGPYHQPPYRQLSPPCPALILSPETPSRYSTLQAPSSLQPSPYPPRPAVLYPEAPSRHSTLQVPSSSQPSPYPPRPAVLYSETPSRHSTLQTPSSSQPSPYPPRPAVLYPETPSRHSTLQAPSSSQPHHLPSLQYPPLPTTPILSRDILVSKPVCYTSQQPSRPVTRAPLVPVVPIGIDLSGCPAAGTPEVPSVSIVIDPHERPVARAPEVPVVPVVIDPHEHPAARAPEPEVPVALVVIDPHEDPKSLRLKAIQEGDRMGKCFKERSEARAGNEQQRARELNKRGEAHKVNMTLLDKEASAKIFQENNQNRRNEVDLHGLYVSEALSYFDISVREARDREESSLRVIVGKGNHSDNKIPKIKPAIQAHGESLGLSIEVDPRNDGCLIVNFK